MANAAVTPESITRADDGLRIDWDDVGHQAFYPARPLRLACPCAGCVEEMSGRPLLESSSIPANIRPVSVALVGAYGLRVVWSDGHNTGIYTFAHLLQRCPCEQCSARRTAGTPA